MKSDLKNLQKQLASIEGRESLMAQAEAIVASCQSILFVWIMKEKEAQKARGIQDDETPELVRLRKEHHKYHLDLVAIQKINPDKEALNRIFTEHEEFAKKHEREVVEYGMKRQRLKIGGKDISSPNGGPK